MQVERDVEKAGQIPGDDVDPTPVGGVQEPPDPLPIDERLASTEVGGLQVERADPFGRHLSHGGGRVTPGDVVDVDPGAETSVHGDPIAEPGGGARRARPLRQWLLAVIAMGAMHCTGTALRLVRARMQRMQHQDGKQRHHDRDGRRPGPQSGVDHGAVLYGIVSPGGGTF
jgi:hypothetical protein